MNRFTTSYAARLCTAIVLLDIGALWGAASAAAATIKIDREFSFVQHDFLARLVAPDPDELGPVEANGGVTSIAVDIYSVEAAPVVLPEDNYDRVELTLRPAGGPRFLAVKLPESFPMVTELDLRWTRPPGDGSAFTNNAQEFTYINGFGTLPSAQGGLYSLNVTGSRLHAQGGFSPVDGSFGFESLTISWDFAPLFTGGTFEPVSTDLRFRTPAGSQVGRPGRFTFIVPESASLAMPSAGGLALALHRRRIRST